MSKAQDKINKGWTAYLRKNLRVSLPSQAGFSETETGQENLPLNLPPILPRPRPRNDLEAELSLWFPTQAGDDSEPETKKKRSSSSGDIKQSLASLIEQVRSRAMSIDQDFVHGSRTLNADRGSKKSPISVEYFVDGKVNGVAIEAFPDSGANASFVAPELVAKLGLTVDKSKQKRVKLANNKTVVCSGGVQLSWAFSDRTEDPLQCWVLPGCVHQLILGDPILKLSNTLTRFKERIKKRARKLSSTLRVNLVGSEQQRLWGTIDGHDIAAIADTGSDLMLISEDAAKFCGLIINRNRENWLEVELADGTRAWTSGCVQDAEWAVGHHTIHSDFYVLPGLRAELVLSKEYVVDFDVYTRFGGLFHSISSIEDAELCNIQFIGKFSEKLDLAEQDWRQDLKSASPFSPAMLQREDARRDDIQAHISRLLAADQPAAQQAERLRQRHWELEKMKRLPIPDAQPMLEAPVLGITSSYSSSMLSSKNRGTTVGLSRGAAFKALWKGKRPITTKKPPEDKADGMR